MRRKHMLEVSVRQKRCMVGSLDSWKVNIPFHGLLLKVLLNIVISFGQSFMANVFTV